MTQKEMVLKYMKQGYKITALDALRDIGCFRLAARINELRNEGHKIKSKQISRLGRFGNKVRLSLYWLESEAKP